MKSPISSPWPVIRGHGKLGRSGRFRTPRSRSSKPPMRDSIRSRAVGPWCRFTMIVTRPVPSCYDNNSTPAPTPEPTDTANLALSVPEPVIESGPETACSDEEQAPENVREVFTGSPVEPVTEPPSGSDAISHCDSSPEPCASGEQGLTKDRSPELTDPPPPKRGRPSRSGEPTPLRKDPQLIAALDNAETERAATRLLERRLAAADWPRSALLAEARLAGIAAEVLDAAARRVGVELHEGRRLPPG
jgi:hypothetical protein